MVGLCMSSKKLLRPGNRIKIYPGRWMEKHFVETLLSFGVVVYQNGLCLAICETFTAAFGVFLILGVLNLSVGLYLQNDFIKAGERCLRLMHPLVIC